MKLEISELIHRVGLQSTIPIEAPCGSDPDLACTGPVRGSLTLTNTGRFLLIQGDLGARVRVQCSRCLKEVEVLVSARIEEEFPLPEADARGVLHWSLEGEPVASILEDYSLDVSELSRQHLSVALPTAPLCEEACRGLCPRCGANLNEGACRCPEREVDERLAGLKVLLERAYGDWE